MRIGECERALVRISRARSPTLVMLTAGRDIKQSIKFPSPKRKLLPQDPSSTHLLLELALHISRDFILPVKHLDALGGCRAHPAASAAACRKF